MTFGFSTVIKEYDEFGKWCANCYLDHSVALDAGAVIRDVMIEYAVVIYHTIQNIQHFCFGNNEKKITTDTDIQNTLI